ncbi:toll-like receptor 4 isoform X2 [Tachypleus tridentatus]|uniref:toll-like receptor 4 isoform X2 n=1 Tax=Tachypleus tridentatus TaxID=6853 RepID=UPI003FD5E489
MKNNQTGGAMESILLKIIFFWILSALLLYHEVQSHVQQNFTEENNGLKISFLYRYHNDSIGDYRVNLFLKKTIVVGVMDIYKLQTLVPRETVHLNISKGNFPFLSRPLFSSLKNLFSLALIQSNISNITSSVFTGLRTLFILDLKQNKIQALDPLLFLETPQITEINLSNNLIYSFRLISEALSSLRFLEMLDLSSNSGFRDLYTRDLQVLQNTSLKQLLLQDCSLTMVEEEALGVLENLNILNLDNNLISEEALENITLGLRNTKIQTLYLRHLRRLTKFPSYGIASLSNTSIEFLYLDKNYLHSTYSLPHMPFLKVLSLNYCSIPFIFSFHNVSALEELYLRGNGIGSMNDDQLSSLTSLRKLDMSDNRKEISRFVLGKRQFFKLVNLKKLYLSKILIYSTLKRDDLYGLINLQILDLSLNYIQIEDFAFETLRSLEFLNLVNNQMKYLSNYTFYGLKSLHFLLLKGNLLVLENNTYPFKMTPSLQVLFLDNNKIKLLKPKTFSFCTNVRNLTLSHNKLMAWNESVFSNKPNLVSLHLDSNQISHVTQAMLKDFNNLQYLTLSRNPFDCHACGMDVFQQWLRSTNVSIGGLNVSRAYSCQRTKELEGQSILNVQIPTDHCRVHVVNVVLIISATLSCTASFVTVLTLAGYRFRWYIKYYWFWLRTKVKRYREIQEAENYIYDVFVSYNSAETEWVYQRLLPALETGEIRLKVCIHDRDFELGRPITENIIEAIAKSRKTLLVLSDSFVKSNWCMFELNMAQHRLMDESRDALILVCLSRVDEKLISKNLKYLMKTRTYIPWTEDVVGQKLFWKRLKLALCKTNVQEDVIDQV